MRQWAALAAIWTAAIGLISGANAASSIYGGGYNGLGPASGMAMILEQDRERVYGRVVDGQSNVFQINGQVVGNTVEGTLRNAQAQASFRLEVRPSGINFVFIPHSADGRANTSAQRTYAFARGRVVHPALADYRVPPPKPGDVVDVILFLENYRSWSYGDVATAYGGVPEADRSLFRLFDHLHADLMLRLCRADADSRLIADVSQSQSVGCRDLMAHAAKAEAMSVMRDFYDVTEFQRGSVYTAFACDRDLYPPKRCLNVDKLISHAAANWRPADAIFADLTDSSKSVASVLGFADAVKAQDDDEQGSKTRPRGKGEAPASRSPVLVADGGEPAEHERSELYDATRGVRLGPGTARKTAQTRTADATPSESGRARALANRIEGPRRRPSSIAETAVAEKAGVAQADPRAAIRPIRRPAAIASDTDLARVRQSGQVSTIKQDADGAGAPNMSPAPLRPSLVPSFETAFNERPRRKPARFEPERVPSPRLRPAGRDESRT